MADKAQFFKVSYKTAYEEFSYILPALSHTDAKHTIQNEQYNVTNTEFLGWHSVDVFLENDTNYYFEANILGQKLRYTDENYGFYFLNNHFHQEILKNKKAYWDSVGHKPY